MLEAQIGRQRGDLDFAKKTEAPFPNNATGGLAHDTEDAADAAGLVTDRIVGDVEVGLFRESMALKEERMVGRPECLICLQHLFKQRTQHVLPKLLPDLAGRPP